MIGSTERKANLLQILPSRHSGVAATKCSASADPSETEIYHNKVKFNQIRVAHGGAMEIGDGEAYRDWRKAKKRREFN